MNQWLATIGRQVSRAMFALAALFLVLGPVLDSAAKAATFESEPGSIEHVLRAFDVIDDVLDHLPGQPPCAGQHQIQIPHALPSPVETSRVPVAARPAWGMPAELLYRSTDLDGVERPPRN